MCSLVNTCPRCLQAKSRLHRAVTTAMVRLDKKINSLRRQGASKDTWTATQRLADLLMANIYSIPAGEAVASVEDWDSPGTMVTIPLDPLKPAVATAEALYAKARKQRRAVDHVIPLLQAAHSELEYLQEAELMLDQLSGTGDKAALREMEDQLAADGYVKPVCSEQIAAKAASKARRAAKRSAKQGGDGERLGSFRQYTSPSGLTVLVGRNSRQNDELTMRKAQPSDVWMHARGVPGAHVLLRVPAGRTPADNDVQFAADVAAFFSKSRSDGKVDVTCARPTDISKPRKSAWRTWSCCA